MFADLNIASNLFPVPQPISQRHSEVDLASMANGNFDGSKVQRDSNKLSDDSHMSRPNGSRDAHRRSEWWRPRRQRDYRNGGYETPIQQHDAMLDPTSTSSPLDGNSPTASSGRTSRTGKLKSFFRRKSGRATDQEKQLSSHGSSSQLPTSDPGRSMNSDE